MIQRETAENIWQQHLERRTDERKKDAAESGFTVNCHFYQNILEDNPVQIEVQRSRDNEINHNTVIGGKMIIEYNDSLPEEEMENYFHDNIYQTQKV